jgi:hypothetical protein
LVLDSNQDIFLPAERFGGGEPLLNHSVQGVKDWHYAATTLEDLRGNIHSEFEEDLF